MVEFGGKAGLLRERSLICHHGEPANCWPAMRLWVGVGRGSDSAAAESLMAREVRSELLAHLRLSELEFCE
jgi:hypothetical protein